MIAVAARKDFCSISKIHPILMYNLRVSCTCRRSLVITCKQSVCYFVYCVLHNVLVNTEGRVGITDRFVCVLKQRCIFSYVKVGNVFDDTLSRYIMCVKR